MYSLINKIRSKQIFACEAPSFLLSWILAEAFYKFGSFTLETGAFLVTWYGTGYLFQKFIRK